MTQIARRTAFRDIENLQSQMNRLFEPFFGRIPAFADDEVMGSGWIPPVDIEETGDRLVVRAELPGMKAEDIDVRVENGTLTIRGERRFENERSERNFHRVERSYGSFSRSFTLPTTISTEDVEARYENGVLELAMRKREEARPRRIPISNGSGQAIDTTAKS